LKSDKCCAEYIAGTMTNYKLELQNIRWAARVGRLGNNRRVGIQNHHNLTSYF